MDDKMVNALAGMFARSNMGMPRASVDEVRRAIQYPINSPRSGAEAFCAQFMETDEHEDMFAAEAEMWAKSIREDGEEEIRRVHPDIMEIWDAAQSPK